MKRSSRPQQDDDLTAILDSDSHKAGSKQKLAKQAKALKRAKQHFRPEAIKPPKKHSSKEEKKSDKKRNEKAACKTEKAIQAATTTGATKNNTMVSKYNVMMPTSMDSMYKTAQPQR